MEYDRNYTGELVCRYPEEFIAHPLPRCHNKSWINKVKICRQDVSIVIKIVCKKWGDPLKTSCKLQSGLNLSVICIMFKTSQLFFFVYMTNHTFIQSFLLKCVSMCGCELLHILKNTIKGIYWLYPIVFNIFIFSFSNSIIFKWKIKWKVTFNTELE